MSLHDRLQQEIKTAMLAREAERLNALRMLKSAIGYAAIEKKSDTLSDLDFVAVVQREIKKRRDAVEQYTAGGRAELAAKENAEIAVLQSFLPPPLTPEELESVVRTAMQELGATDKKQMGSVMKAVQAKVGGRADGKTISALVSRLLG
jgi:uncharacterized protein YqeY